jgi:hypothetical protein
MKTKGAIAMNANKQRGTHPIQDDVDVKEALAELQAIADRGEHADGEGQKYFDQLMEEVTMYQIMYCGNPQPTAGETLRNLLVAARAIRQNEPAEVAVACGMGLQSPQDLADEKRAMERPATGRTKPSEYRPAKPERIKGLPQKIVDRSRHRRIS